MRSHMSDTPHPLHKGTSLLFITLLTSCGSPEPPTRECSPPAPAGYECIEGAWRAPTTTPADMRASTPDMPRQTPTADMQAADMLLDDMSASAPDMGEAAPDMNAMLDMATPPEMPPTPRCGDRQIDPGEQCDDGGQLDGDGCDASCQQEPGYNCGSGRCVSVCGDGITLSDFEECDDGNQENQDGCSSFCRVETGYSCDSGSSTCTAICGDGRVRGDEECDDGERDGAAGCQDDCTITLGWICEGEPSVCENRGVGNAQIDDGEQCDDGNLIDGDGCSSTGQIELPYFCPQVGQPCVAATTITHGPGAAAPFPATTNTNNVYTSLCPDDHLPMGLEGFMIEGNGLGKTQLRCRAVTIDGLTGELEWGAASKTPRTYGATSTRLNPLECPRDTFAVGFTSYLQYAPMFGLDVSFGVSLECAPLTLQAGAIEQGVTTSTSIYGTQTMSTPYSHTCSVAAQGLAGEAGWAIDRFSLYCGAIVPSP